MATQADIDLITANLPQWAEDYGWDSYKISTVRDMIPGDIRLSIRAFWVQRAADTSPYTDANESGSSRPMSQAYEHAMAQLAYWDHYISTSYETKLGKIKRRYRRRRGVYIGVDDFGYGTPYARTD